MKDKKAEITTQQLILLIVLIIGFVIILFLLFRLNLGKESDKDICHNSVMNKATLLKTIGGDNTPLDCKRSYICLSQDGTCKSMYKPTIIKVKTDTDVYKALATELTDCWWMFGEGKTDYLGTAGTWVPEMRCSLCSQIAFDSSISKNIPAFSNSQLDEKKLYEYMAANKMPEKSITYFQYLYGTNDLKSKFGDLSKNNLEIGKLNLNEQYFAMMAFPKDVSKPLYISAGAIAGMATLVGVTVAVVGTGGAAAIPLIIMGGAAVTGGTGGYFLVPIVEGFSGKSVSPPFLIGTDSKALEQFKNLGCKDIETSS